MRRLLALAVFAFLVLAFRPGLAADDPENLLIMDLPAGQVVIRLRPDLAPNHVARIKTLARAGFYDGLKFHRVIDGFMAQTGDPTGTGRGKSTEPNLKAEFSKLPFRRGVVGMARGGDPNSANCQFFITYADAPWLNGQYTAFGEVVSGMEAVDKLARGEPPLRPDAMLRLRVAADAR